ncbi:MULTISPECIES: AfsA-related hotdog domain-containing protein [Pseudomonas]|nr:MULTISPECIES: AfsA-related hotdog domain-containing protein [Pseudomonas]
MEELSVSSSVSSCPFSGFSPLSSHQQEPPRHYVVVGDRIKSQCSDNLFISVTAAEEMVAQLAESEKLTLHVGQGVTDEQLNTLYGFKEALAPTLNILPVEHPPRASSSATHKLKSHNIAISAPWENGNGTYSASLMIDDANAELSDHLTGQHVSGMMVIEAARQMTIAVAEAYYVTPAAKGKVNFVTNKMDVTYRDFLLPIHTEILCIPVELRRSGASNFRFGCRLEFKQQNQCLVVLGFELSVIDSRYFQLKEAQLLHQFVKRLA